MAKICSTTQEAIDLLRHCLDEGEVVLTNHFRQELVDEALSIEDAWAVMQSGTVYEPPDLDIRSGEWKWKVEGYEPGGKWLVIVFSFKPVARTFLITVYSVDKKGR
jgi:uncharacterized protein DUF4258